MSRKHKGFFFFFHTVLYPLVGFKIYIYIYIYIKEEFDISYEPKDCDLC